MTLANFDSTALALLHHPSFHRPLEFRGSYLLDQQSGDRFPIRAGIPSFLTRQPAPWRHRFWRGFYDQAAFLYDPVLALGERIGLGTESQIRREVIARLSLPPQARILDLGCGTGASRPYLPAAAFYMGLDASFGMLRRARRKNSRLKLPAIWLHADAQSLPLQTAAFDLVLCMGLLQHLSAPAQAINEMLRVCVPGGKILLLDELASAGSVSRRLAGVPRRSSQPNAIADALTMYIPVHYRMRLEQVLLSEYYAVSLILEK